MRIVKDNYGFIKSCDKPVSLYFHFNDVVSLQKEQHIDRFAIDQLSSEVQGTGS